MKITRSIQRLASTARRLSLREAAGTTRPALAPRAFTVMELLVAIGAVALVTVGLAAIFDAVGKTVQGGRRVSVLTQYSTMIEAQLRKDFASIDPNSFIVIRQQAVDGGDNKTDATDSTDLVPLYRGQPFADQRPRRIDELLIFTRGDFASMRPPVAEERVARSREARVYYGMGQKMEPSYNGDSEQKDYETPYAFFRTNPPDVDLPDLGKAGINQFASEWTLLRHVTVLQQPRIATPDVGQIDRADLRSLGINQRLASSEDADGQIALHPAAATIFRATQPRLPARMVDLLSIDDINGHTIFATGTVDVATTDLDEVRSWVLGMRERPDPRVLQFDVADLQQLQFTTPGRGEPSGFQLTNVPSLCLQQMWMSNAFPTESQPEAVLPNYWPDPTDFDPPNRRVRYETQPVGMRGVLESDTPRRNDYATRALQDAYERTGQVMLTAHNFVPRCTEFIVEWSFGRMNPSTNELIWHGPPRQGLVDQEKLCFYPYEISANEYLEEGAFFSYLYKTRNASAPDNPDQGVVEQRFHPFTDRLIYGHSPDRSIDTPPACVTSYFGYIDPTFNPTNPVPDDPSTPSQDESQGRTGRSIEGRLMDWPRPKLVRITMSLADPREPAVEETFQFVLEVPQTRAR